VELKRILSTTYPGEGRSQGIRFFDIYIICQTVSATATKCCAEILYSNVVWKCQKTIDILKLDVEASEWGALESMLEEKMLDRVKQLAIEIHTNEIYRIKSSMENLVRFSTILHRLEEIGFRKWRWNFNMWGFFPARDGSKYLSCCYEIVYVNINYVK